MGLLDMIYGNQPQAQQAGQAAVDPNAINPIWGVPEALIQEMKKEQQKAEMSQAWSNLFGGAANIARGAQGGPPIYDAASAAGDPNAALDGLAKRVMMFSQLRQNYEQQAQAQAMKKMLPDVAKKLGVPVEALAQLPDAEKTKYIMAAMAPVAPEQVNIKVPQGELTVLKIVDPVTKAISYKRLDGTPVDTNAINQEVADAEAKKEATKAQAKIQGEKAAVLDTTLANIEDMNRKIQNVLDDPNLPKSVGALWNRYMTVVPGSPEYGLTQKIEQLKGQSFLNSISAMKGLGSLSNMEGEKTAAAFMRLNQAQNEQDFRAALAEAQQQLARQMDAARKDAGLAPSRLSTSSEWVNTDFGGRLRRTN